MPGFGFAVFVFYPVSLFCSLNLMNNKFSGVIPESWCTLPALNLLNLHDNEISGVFCVHVAHVIPVLFINTFFSNRNHSGVFWQPEVYGHSEAQQQQSDWRTAEDPWPALKFKSTELSTQ